MDRLMNLLETVISFDAARKRLTRPQPSDKDKYMGALAAKKFYTKDIDTSTPMGSAVADFVQDCLTTMISGQSLSDEQVTKAQNFVDLSYHSNKISVHSAVSDIIDAFNKQHPEEKVNLIYSNPELEYVHDDPGYSKERLVTWKSRKEIFAADDVLELYQFVFTHYLPRVRDGFELPKVEKWITNMENMVSTHKDSSARWAASRPAFDPKGRDEYKQNGTTPYVDKLVQKWQKPADPESHRGYIFVDEYNTPPALYLRPRHGNEGMKTFETTRELSDFIEANEKKLQAWYDRQQTRKNPAPQAIIRALKSLLVKAYAAAHNSTEMPKEISSYDTRSMLDELDNPKLRDLFLSLFRDMQHPSMHQFYDKAHEDFILGAIDRMAKGGEMYE